MSHDNRPLRSRDRPVQIAQYASGAIFISKTGSITGSDLSLITIITGNCHVIEFQWNEKEKIILDELWIVLEEKLELRKQLLTARQAVSDKLTHIDEFERLQGISSCSMTHA